MLKQSPLTWNSAYQPCLFEVDSPSELTNGTYATATNVGGKLNFTSSTFPFIANFGTQFMIAKSGIYQGLHKIISMSSSDILTDSIYVGASGPIQVTGAFPYNLKISYGYPAQTNVLMLKTNYRPDGRNVTDIAPALAAMFEIKPPVLGFDENYYTHFRVGIEPGSVLQSYLDSSGFTVESLFGYNSNANKWAVINGCLTNAELEVLISGGGAITDVPPVFNSCSQVWFTNIIGDRLFHNLFNGGGGLLPPNLGGIGFMGIEIDFIVS